MVPRPGTSAPLGVLAGEAAGEQVVEQGVAQALGGGDDRLGALDGVVDAFQHGGDGPLLWQGREQDVRGPLVASRVSPNRVTPLAITRELPSLTPTTLRIPLGTRHPQCSF